METPPVYSSPTIATAAVPRVESWSEIRCPACVPLGWDSSRLLFKISGGVPATDACIEVRCHRCKSLVSWRIGTLELRAIRKGPKNNRRQEVAFE